MKKIMKIFLNLLLTLILLITGVSLYLKISDYKKGEETYKGIAELYKKDNSFEEKFNELKAINPNYKFWLTIEGTNINYPVVQTKDNEEYLKKDFNGDKSNNGSIFLDYRSNFPNDFESTIYGHNMRNDTMFYDLNKFKEEDFFKENNKITITDKNTEYIYEVFSVYTVKASDYETFEFLNKNDENFLDNHIKKLQEKSFYKKDLTVSSYDNIITLMTCSYEAKDNRTIVHGKLLQQ